MATLSPQLQDRTKQNTDDFAPLRDEEVQVCPEGGARVKLRGCSHFASILFISRHKLSHEALRIEQV